jgi:hypothetical protein
MCKMEILTFERRLKAPLAYVGRDHIYVPSYICLMTMAKFGTQHQVDHANLTADFSMLSRGIFPVGDGTLISLRLRFQCDIV